MVDAPPGPWGRRTSVPSRPWPPRSRPLSRAHLVRPQRLAGRYRLDRCLAIGGMAEVWLGADEVLGRQVAAGACCTPTWPTTAPSSSVSSVRPWAVARINHPGIVAVFDTVNDAGYEAVVMEYVPGENLRQLLDSRGQLEIDETILLGSSLADAFNVAHDAGIVHRDVKPGNVLLTPEGRVKLHRLRDRHGDAGRRRLAATRASSSGPPSTSPRSRCRGTWSTVVPTSTPSPSCSTSA